MYKSILLFAITLFFCVNVSAQNDLESINVFVRVYNLEGKKINKGKILSISETSLQLNNDGLIPLSTIGFIKTNRSAGHNVLVGALIGAVPFSVNGAVTADPDAFLGNTVAEGAAGGALIGGIVGSAIGGISILTKINKTYIINGEKVKWKAFKELIIK